MSRCVLSCCKICFYKLILKELCFTNSVQHKKHNATKCAGVNNCTVRNIGDAIVTVIPDVLTEQRGGNIAARRMELQSTVANVPIKKANKSSEAQ